MFLSKGMRWPLSSDCSVKPWAAVLCCEACPGFGGCPAPPFFPVPCRLCKIQKGERGNLNFASDRTSPCSPASHRSRVCFLPPPCCALGGCKIGSPARANVFVGVSAKSSIKEGFKELRHWLFTYINCLGERKIWKKEQGFWFEDILLKAGVSKQKVSETWSRAQVTLKLRHLPWIW